MHVLRIYTHFHKRTHPKLFSTVNVYQKHVPYFNYLRINRFNALLLGQFHLSNLHDSWITVRIGCHPLVRVAGIYLFIPAIISNTIIWGDGQPDQHWVSCRHWTLPYSLQLIVCLGITVVVCRGLKTSWWPVSQVVFHRSLSLCLLQRRTDCWLVFWKCSFLPSYSPVVSSFVIVLSWAVTPFAISERWKFGGHRAMKDNDSDFVIPLRV